MFYLLGSCKVTTEDRIFYSHVSIAYGIKGKLRFEFDSIPEINPDGKIKIENIELRPYYVAYANGNFKDNIFYTDEIRFRK